MANTTIAPRMPDANGQNVVRKKRKRTSVAGAAVDCFTCVSKEIRCDRRRPYCAQCLEAGQDCAGYKTQLTWGVGVASRGKLRGLSLPVVGTAKVEGPNPFPNAKKRRGTIVSQNEDLEKRNSDIVILNPTSDPLPNAIYNRSSESKRQRTGSSWGDLQRTATQIVSSVNERGDLSDAQHRETSTSSAMANVYSECEDRQPPPVSTMWPHDVKTYADPDLPYLQPQVNQTRPYGNLHVNTASMTSVGSMSTYYDGPFSASLTDTLLTGSPTDASTSYPASEVNGFRDVFLPHSHADSILPNQEHFKDEIQRSIVDDCAVLEDDTLSLSAFWKAPSPSFTLSMNQTIGKTPRIQYLISYYAEVISPVIVAFDSSSNPFRTQILQLASNSETLQHAISALSASNLRQRLGGVLSKGRTAPARRSSMAHVSLADAERLGQSPLSPEDRIREEIYHKRWAVAHLNKQLADPLARRDDAILATLLVLCLFHICDSGIAKFQTQFAGVKKLLALRGNNIGLGNEESKWMARLFTWFDSLAATVNDRESQLSGSHVESSFSTGDWSLETLAGVDGQLFRVIAKLGRLNVLRQGGNVESSPLIVPKPAPAPSKTPSFDPNHFDGNGWMRISEDEDLFNLRSSPTSDTSTPHSSRHSTQFWREWREIRHELQLWSPNNNIHTANAVYFGQPTPTLAPEQLIDIEHISNAFRYSALLYTERLSNPTASPSSENIQQWVQQAIRHMKDVQSDVYLLWPLFIVGSECVSEANREVIRGRCADIQKDSGFVNNRSCLDLLEKVWVRMDQDMIKSGHATAVTEHQNEDVVSKTPFKFREVMIDEKNEGEYIVV